MSGRLPLAEAGAVLITDSFLFVHQPKTGGTFVRQVIDAASRAELRSWPLGRLRRNKILRRRCGYSDTLDYHDTCHAIPSGHQHKQIVSAVRNPFDFYVSFYHFGWWAAHPEDSYRDFHLVQQEFPSFPDLSFQEFLQLANRFFVEFDEIGAVTGDPFRFGYYSTQFLIYFFQRPLEVHGRIDDYYLNSEAWAADMFPVHFLKTATLNQDLFQFLKRANFPIRYIRGTTDKPPVRPAELFKTRPSAQFKNYYTTNTYEFVCEKERLLLTMFPEFGGKQTFANWVGQ